MSYQEVIVFRLFLVGIYCVGVIVAGCLLERDDRPLWKEVLLSFCWPVYCFMATAISLLYAVYWLIAFFVWLAMPDD